MLQTKACREKEVTHDGETNAKKNNMNMTRT